MQCVNTKKLKFNIASFLYHVLTLNKRVFICHCSTSISWTGPSFSLLVCSVSVLSGPAWLGDCVWLHGSGRWRATRSARGCLPFYNCSWFCRLKNSSCCITETRSSCVIVRFGSFFIVRTMMCALWRHHIILCPRVMTFVDCSEVPRLFWCSVSDVLCSVSDVLHVGPMSDDLCSAFDVWCPILCVQFLLYLVLHTWL